MGMAKTAAQEGMSPEELLNPDSVEGGAPQADEEGGDHEQDSGVDASVQEGGGGEGHEGDDGLNGAADASDEEREAIRARRREERQLKKVAARERESSFKREISARDSIINEMRQRLDAVERKSVSADLASLDASLKQSSDAYNYYKDQIRAASAAGNHAGVAEAVEKMNLALRSVEELSRVKTAYTQRGQQPPTLDPRVLSHAQAWASKNSWYNPVGQSREDRIVRILDEELANEGWSPATKEYWEELDSRTKKYLPHRYKGSYNSTQERGGRSPVAGSGRESQSAPSAGFRLSEDRVKALKDAGIWDDPKKRAEAINRFRAYDAEKRHGAAE